MKNIFAFFILSLLLFSCKTQENISSNPNVFVVYDGSADKSFANQFGEYKYYFTRTNGFQGFRLHGSGIYKRSKSINPSGFTAMTLGTDDGFEKFYVNEHKVSELIAMLKEDRIRYAESQSGKNVNFRYVEAGKEMYNVSLYTPEEIVIDTVLSQITRIPQSRLGNFKLGNKLYLSGDTNNKHGLLLSLSYRGYNLNNSLGDIENSNNDAYIKKFLYVVEDTGEIEFPDGFFDGIPDSGIFYMQIDRLNFSVFEFDGNSQKVSTGSSLGIDLALGR